MADEAAPVKQEGGAQFNVIIRNQTQEEVHFKIKQNTRFSKIIAAYCNKKALQADAVLFMFDGVPLKPEQTPADIGMEDGDVVDCFLHQIGGQGAL